MVLIRRLGKKIACWTLNRHKSKRLQIWEPTWIVSKESTYKLHRIARELYYDMSDKLIIRKRKVALSDKSVWAFRHHNALVILIPCALTIQLPDEQTINKGVINIKILKETKSGTPRKSVYGHYKKDMAMACSSRSTATISTDVFPHNHDDSKTRMQNQQV